MPISRITSILPGSSQSQNQNEPPSELERSGNQHSTNIDVLADVAAEQAARRRAGMCPQCGVVQTHTIVLWGRRRKPIQNVPNRVYKGICLQCNSMAQAQAENANREGASDEDQGTFPSPVQESQTSDNSSNPNNTSAIADQSHQSNLMPVQGRDELASIQQERNIPCQSNSSSDQGEERPGPDNEDNLGGYLKSSSQLRSGTSTETFVLCVPRDDDISVITYDSKGDDGGNYNASRSTLGGIAEENDSEIISGSQRKEDTYPPRTLSNGSVDPSMRTGSLAVTSEVGVEDCRMDRIPLLARKMEQVGTVGSINHIDSIISQKASAVSTHKDARILDKQESNSTEASSQAFACGNFSRKLIDGMNNSVGWEERAILTNGKVDQSICDELNKSNDGNTLTGMQTVNVGDSYVTLLEKKKADAEAGSSGTSPPQPSSVEHAKIDQNATRTVPADELMSESESRSLIAHCSSCSELIDALKLSSSSSSEAAVLQVLSNLRASLLDAYGLTDSLESRGHSKIAFLTSAWAKTLTKVMSSHSSHPNIQSETLHTLWAIITLHPQYVSDLMSSDNMKQVISTMQHHIKDERIQERGCGLLFCIAANQDHALRLVGMHNGEFINRLMAALHFRGRHGKVQASALKALFRLSSASMSSESSMEFMTSTMGKCVEGDLYVGGNSSKAIMAVISTMDIHRSDLSVQVEGNRLLWNILDLDCGIVDTDLLCILMGRTLQHLENAMGLHQRSHVFHETAICLLSKMSCFRCDSIEPTLFLHIIRLVVDTLMAATMLANSNGGIVASHGCRSLVNICSTSPIFLLSKPVVDGIPVILTCMNTWQYDFSLQSEACAAISVICKNEPTNKERVHRLNGIGIIMRAFDLTPPPHEKLSLESKLRACLALTTLAVDPIVMCDIQDKGIFSKLEILIEEDPTIPAELHHAIQDLLNLASDDENMGRNLVFQERASEEGTCDCLRANLRVVTSPDFARNRITYLRSSALRAIERFPDSARVQEHGCKLLACLFDLASDNEYFARYMLSSVELELSEEPDLLEEMRIITLSLVKHKNEPANTAAACSALQNLCVLFALSCSDDISDLTLVLFSSLSEVISAFSLHQEDSKTLEHIIGALWSLCAVRDELVPEVVNSIGLVTETMNRFHDTVDLRRRCIGLLGLFFSMSEGRLFFVDDDLIYAITKFIKDETDYDDSGGDGLDLIDAAVNIILVLTKSGFDAIRSILRNELLVDAIVGCMFKYPESLCIHGACIDILTNIAVDNYIRADVCHKGGTTRIISALKNLKHDPIVVCKAFMALSNLIGGAEVAILRAHDSPAAKIFIEAMKTHPQTLYIQVAATYALWALAAMDDSFKDEIVKLGGTDVIVAAMEQFIGSKHMQVRGFVAIWSLAVRRHLKKRVGRCSIEQITNGLRAHISSEKACEDALGCLTCLSTTPVNKELLVAHCAADLIYNCMWMHSENPAVCNVALSALCNVSVDIEKDEVSDITSDDLEAVVNAMRAHRNVQVIQKRAMILLRNFTFSQSNIVVMAQNRYLVPLIHLAVSTHNDLFQGRAQDLLRILPPLILGSESVIM